MFFLKSTGYDIIYVERTTSWISETTVYAGANTDSAPVLSLDASNGNLYCFWALSPTANHIIYKKSIDGVWDSSPTDWIDASSTGITYGRSINSFYQVLNGSIGLEYTTGSANPYDVRYAFLNVTMPASSFS